MKSLLLGVVVVILLGFGGLVYRNAVERPYLPAACTLDAMVCPDGTALGRTGPFCEFPTCPPPNVSFTEARVAFATPEGFTAVTLPDAASIAAYEKPGPTPSEPSTIIIRRFHIATSSTALATIRETAIGGTSGLPVSATSFTSTVIGERRFTVVSIERFEAVVNTAYYLVRNSDVLRFDAIDRGVINWTNPTLDLFGLSAHSALRGLLITLQER